MSIVNMVHTIKQVHTKDIVIIRIGKFCNCYGKDAYIMAYLFKYKIQKIAETPFCGFPVQAENKVRALLEQRKINYIIIDRRNNYEVEDKQDFKNLNTYEEMCERAKKYRMEKSRIEKIYQILLDNICKIGNMDRIKRIEEITNEGRKI